MPGSASRKARGPLNVPRSPQGHPLPVQAGSSGAGEDFAARHARAVSTAQQTLADARGFYQDLKGRRARYGGSGDDLKILPGIFPLIGSTQAEAVALERELTHLQVPEYGLAQLSEMLGTDLTGLPLDGPLPELPDEADSNGDKSRFALVSGLARREGLTLRELIARLGGGRGHRVVAGTPERIADALEGWFTQGAADGFTTMPPHLPGGPEDFVDHVVPVLQDRGCSAPRTPDAPCVSTTAATPGQPVRGARRHRPAGVTTPEVVCVRRGAVRPSGP